jgi:hypothetical protein
MKLFDEIYKFNLKKELKKINASLINECKRDRFNFNKNIENNFYLNSKHTGFLYSLFLKYSKKVLNEFTLKDTDFKCWGYFSDKTFTNGNWHNHLRTCTINGVIYVKLPKKEKGIDFKINNLINNFIPKKYDMLIFPSYLDHYPHPSTTSEPRISINLELRCNEKPENIFK